jgi:hypothetical protein
MISLGSPPSMGGGEQIPHTTQQFPLLMREKTMWGKLLRYSSCTQTYRFLMTPFPPDPSRAQRILAPQHRAIGSGPSSTILGVRPRRW